jgi:hypothetical protein
MVLARKVKGGARNAGKLCKCLVAREEILGSSLVNRVANFIQLTELLSSVFDMVVFLYLKY